MPKPFEPAKRLAGQLDDHTSVDRLGSWIATRRRFDGDAVSSAGGGRDFGGEIGFLLLDALAERVAHEARDLDRTADLAFGFLQRLRDTSSCRR